MTAANVHTARRSWVEQIMGMPISIHLRGAAQHVDSPAAAAVVGEVFELMRDTDRVFSTYRPDSAVSRLRHGELPEPRYAPLVREVLDLCAQARERTAGYFDARLPGGFDPSGLVKGWAVQRAATLLEGIGSCDYYVNAGGDIAMNVASEHSPAWVVGIEDPRDRTRMLTTRAIRSGAIATSGTAARGAHIVDPHTGVRPDDLLAVTAIGPSVLWADVYATAAFACGGVADWLRTRAPEYEVVIVERHP